ncbi:hypothetical protein [Loigolactobacillus jiayinensis]|uniref:Uncharacterized protein n=1 Tax=Loigolactobacillus jiayinensis TaxID=2486016 RepID=A0ABW1RC42_9LACO|nr:hypothetical protein [Loigolactobacillus jiayinensis]
MKRKLRNILQVIEEHGDRVDKLISPNTLQLKFAAQPAFVDDLIVDSEVFQLLKLYAADATVNVTAPITELPKFFQKMFQKTSSEAATAYKNHITTDSTITITVELVTDPEHHDIGNSTIKFWD